MVGRYSLQRRLDLSHRWSLSRPAGKHPIFDSYEKQVMHKFSIGRLSLVFKSLCSVGIPQSRQIGAVRENEGRH